MLVGAGDGSKIDRQAIPSVDGDNCRVVVYLYRSPVCERLPVREALLYDLRNSNAGKPRELFNALVASMHM
jgi:hypothetical protein